MGYFYFVITGGICQIYYLYFDWTNGHTVNFLLRFGTVSIIISSLFIIKRTSQTSFRILLNLMTYAVILLELETQFRAEDAVFYHFFNWFGYPVIMFFHAFFFMGLPRHYFLGYFGIVFYYMARALSYYNIPEYNNTNIIEVCSYSFIFTAVSSAINLYWFKLRYTNIEYIHTIQTMNQKNLEETIRRKDAEYRLFILNERERINQELHDTLGGKLTDAGLQIKNFLEKKDFSSANDIQNCITELSGLLRKIVSSSTDLSILDDDFTTAIQISLVRRYSLTDRVIHFTVDEITREILNSKSFKQNSLVVFKILEEVSTNDLKYGLGISTWKISQNDGAVHFEIESRTTYPDFIPEKGNGKYTIRARASQIGATVKEEIINSTYHLSLEFPVPELKSCRITPQSRSVKI